MSEAYDEELTGLIFSYFNDRRRIKCNIFRYLTKTPEGCLPVLYWDEDDKEHVAYARRLYQESRIDQSFGIHPPIIEAMVEYKIKELFIFFMRLNSRISSVYWITDKMLAEIIGNCSRGQQDQYQIPIARFFAKDSYEL